MHKISKSGSLAQPQITSWEQFFMKNSLFIEYRFVTIWQLNYIEYCGIERKRGVSRVNSSQDPTRLSFSLKSKTRSASFQYISVISMIWYVLDGIVTSKQVITYKNADTKEVRWRPYNLWFVIHVWGLTLKKAAICTHSCVCINVLAGAPDTTYRLITTNPGFQLQLPNEFFFSHFNSLTLIT
jgi:hypothetical protein